MDKKEATALVGPILRIIALGFIAAAVLKLFGVLSMRPTVIELSIVAIALAHVR